MNYKLNSLKGRKYLWICTAVLTVVTISQLHLFLGYFHEERSYSEIDLTLTKVKQSLLNVKAVEPVHCGPRITARPFIKGLSEEEVQNAEMCQITATSDRHFDLNSFFKNTKVCVKHHKYLQQNNTIIVEVGGNLGYDASSFARNYNSRQIILEPVQHYANVLQKKFANNSRITVLNFGLGKRTCTVNVDVRGEATSIFANAGNTTVNLVSAREFFTKIRVGYIDIDLLTMDCEGCELDILEDLLQNNLIQYMKNVQFESHGHVRTLKVNNWEDRYCRIQEYMSRTHRLTYQYKHVWENWRRLDSM